MYLCHTWIGDLRLGVIKFWDQNIYNFQTFQGHKEAMRTLSIDLLSSAQLYFRHFFFGGGGGRRGTFRAFEAS